MKNIPLTRATGYIGSRLLDKLLNRPDLSVRLLVRNARKIRGSRMNCTSCGTCLVDFLSSPLFTPEAFVRIMGKGKELAVISRQLAASSLKPEGLLVDKKSGGRA